MNFTVSWDTDGEQIEGLPETVAVPDDVASDEVADWLSNEYGWCVNWARPITRTVKSSELRQGMVVHCHGLRCLITTEVSSRDTGSDQYGPDGRVVYWQRALVLNAYEIKARDPWLWGMCKPRLTNGYEDTEAIARGERHWSIQGNDNKSWAIEA